MMLKKRNFTYLFCLGGFFCLFFAIVSIYVLFYPVYRIDVIGNGIEEVFYFNQGWKMSSPEKTLFVPAVNNQLIIAITGKNIEIVGFRLNGALVPAGELRTWPVFNAVYKDGCLCSQNNMRLVLTEKFLPIVWRSVFLRMMLGGMCSIIAAFFVAWFCVWCSPKIRFGLLKNKHIYGSTIRLPSHVTAIFCAIFILFMLFLFYKYLLLHLGEWEYDHNVNLSAVLRMYFSNAKAYCNYEAKITTGPTMLLPMYYLFHTGLTTLFHAKLFCVIINMTIIIATFIMLSFLELSVENKISYVVVTMLLLYCGMEPYHSSSVYFLNGELSSSILIVLSVFLLANTAKKGEVMTAAAGFAAGLAFSSKSLALIGAVIAPLCFAILSFPPRFTWKNLFPLVKKIILWSFFFIIPYCIHLGNLYLYSSDYMAFQQHLQKINRFSTSSYYGIDKILFNFDFIHKNLISNFNLFADKHGIYLAVLLIIIYFAAIFWVLFGLWNPKNKIPLTLILTGSLFFLWYLLFPNHSWRFRYSCHAWILTLCGLSLLSVNVTKNYLRMGPFLLCLLILFCDFNHFDFNHLKSRYQQVQMLNKNKDIVDFIREQQVSSLVFLAVSSCYFDEWNYFTPIPIKFVRVRDYAASGGNLKDTPSDTLIILNRNNAKVPPELLGTLLFSNSDFSIYQYKGK